MNFGVSAATNLGLSLVVSRELILNEPPKA